MIGQDHHQDLLANTILMHLAGHIFLQILSLNWPRNMSIVVQLVIIVIYLKTLKTRYTNNYWTLNKIYFLICL